MVREKNRSIAVLLTIVLTVVLAVSPALAVAKPDMGKPQNEQVKLQLLAINDFHGALLPNASGGVTYGGAGVLGAYLDYLEADAAGAVTMRLGVGDLIGASPPLSGLLQDEPTLKVLNMLKFDYSAVGNHEFDEGIDELLRLQYGGYHPVTGEWGGSKMQYLAANVVWEDSGEPVLPPYAIKTIRGIPVGFIGAVYEETPSIVTASGVAGLEFLDEAESINKYVEVLKDKGVEAIIVLLHNGGSGVETGGPVSGDVVSVVEAIDDEVDVVLNGHTHNRYWGMIDGKLVTSAWYNGRAIADVDLVLDRKSGDVVEKTASIVRTAHVEWLVPHAQAANAARYVAKIEAYVAPIVDRVIGTAATDITRTQNTAGESALGSFIADSQRWKMGTDVAFMNPGGIRADLLAGEVTWGELFTIQPFANYLVTMDLTGAQIEALLEQQWNTTSILQISGITYSWDPAAPVGSRVDPANIMIGGAPLNLAATYSVTVNNFLSDGGDGFTILRDGTNKVYGPIDLDALVDYVMQLPQPFSAAIDGRITQILP